MDGLLDKGFNRLMAGNEAAPVNWGGKVGQGGRDLENDQATLNTTNFSHDRPIAADHTNWT